MHEMLTILTGVRSVCQSVCYAAARAVYVGHLLRPLPNFFGLLLKCIPWFLCTTILQGLIL